MSETQLEKEYIFRDIGRRTRIVEVLLATMIFLLFVGIVFRIMEINLLQDAWDGVFASHADFTAAATVSDQRVATIGYIQTAFQVSLIIAICFWVYRACSNAHAISRIELVISPRWAVGWYFIPFANLVMPYQAMCEIWSASEKPENWKSEDRNWRLPVWWTLWLGTNIVSSILVRIPIEGMSIGELQTFSDALATIDIVVIVACITLFSIVSRITAMQAYRPQDVF